MKEMLPRSASKHKVTNALRKALEQYFKRIDQGYSREDAEFAAITIFESTLRNDVGEVGGEALAKLINALKNLIALTEQEKLSEPIGALKRKTFIDETTRMVYTVFRWEEKREGGG